MSTIKNRVLLYVILVILSIIGYVLFYNWVKMPSYAKKREVLRKNETPPSDTKDQEIASLVQIKEFIKEDTPLDVILLLDQSGSMKQTDPANTRITAIEYIINNIAQKSTEKVIHRIGVVEFGSKAPKEMQIHLLEAKKDGNILDVTKKIKPRDLGDTNFTDALSTAYEDLVKNNSLAGTRKIKIIVFTDGEPDDSRRSTITIKGYFDEINELLNTQFKGVPLDLYIVICDKKGTIYSRTSNYWKNIAGEKNVFHLKDIDDLNITFNTIVRRMYDIPENIPSTILSDEKQEESFDIPPYLSTIEFHVFTPPVSKETEIAIYKPDGSNLLQELQSKEVKNARKTEITSGKIIVVNNPDPGLWKYQFIKGKGKITIERNEIPIKFSLISPDPSTSFYPQGKPMLIKLSYERKDGEPIKEDPQNPIIITAAVFDPEGKVISHIKFDKDKSGLLVADNTVDTSKPGIYTIKMSFKGGVGKFEYEQTNKISVIPLPYLVIKSPPQDGSVHLSKTLPIEITAMMAGKPLDVKKFFAPEVNPDSIVMATYLSSEENGKKVSVHIPLQQGSNNTFIKEIPLDHSIEGNYLIEATINGKPGDKNVRMQPDSTYSFFSAVRDPAVTGNIENEIKKDKLKFWLMGFPIWVLLIGNGLFLIIFFGFPHLFCTALGGQTAVIKIGNEQEARELPALYGAMASAKTDDKIKGGKSPQRQLFIFREPSSKKNSEEEWFSAAIINWFLFIWLPQFIVLKKTRFGEDGVFKKIGNSNIKIKIK